MWIWPSDRVVLHSSSEPSVLLERISRQTDPQYVLDTRPGPTDRPYEGWIEDDAFRIRPAWPGRRHSFRVYIEGQVEPVGTGSRLRARIHLDWGALVFLVVIALVVACAALLRAAVVGVAGPSLVFWLLYFVFGGLAPPHADGCLLGRCRCRSQLPLCGGSRTRSERRVHEASARRTRGEAGVDSKAMAPAQPSWPPVHPFSRALHAVAVGIGATVAVVGLVRSAWLAGVEPDHLTTKRGATCAALLVVAAAYSFTGRPRWSTWRAIPFFLWSYILVGVTVMAQMGSIVKDFAPDDPTTMDYATAYGKIVGALAVAFLLAFNALRAAKARTLPQTPELAGPSRRE